MPGISLLVLLSRKSFRPMTSILRFFVAGTSLALLLGSPALADVDDPVQSGREAFDKSTDYPWYDKSADDVRPVGLKAPKEEPAAPKETRESVSLPGAEIIAWIIVGVAIVAIVGMLIYAILNSEGPAPQAAKKPQTQSVDLEALPVPIAAADSDLLAEARRLYGQGDFAKAMIYLYSHLLLRLDKGQLIRLAKGKTNRQYLREVGNRKSLAEYFESAMHAFESAFFGRRELPRDEFEAAWRRIDDFHRLVEEAHA
jgi:hypothetical protein